MAKVKYRVREYTPTANQGGTHSFFAEAVINTDITPDVLTPEELEQLKHEIEAEQRGEFILDSVLNDPNVFSRGK